MMIRSLSCLALCLVLGACASAPNPAPPPSSGPSFYDRLAASGASVDPVAARDMISIYRRNNGLGGLMIDPALQRAAPWTRRTIWHLIAHLQGLAARMCAGRLPRGPALPIGASLPGGMSAGETGRDVAQPGSASHWGCGGRRFESCRPDQPQKWNVWGTFHF